MKERVWTMDGSPVKDPTTTDSQQKIVGIDPGLRVTGYAVLEMRSAGPAILEAGVIRVKASQPLSDRLAELFEGIQQVLESDNIVAMALEQVFSHYERPQTAVLMGHARGVICLAASLRGVPVHDYAATSVKQLLTGSGRANKVQMQAAICREYGLGTPPEPHDVADALAIATCHYHSLGKACTIR
jgi:crossover junction endodeoxyribonuclease RuvC